MIRLYYTLTFLSIISFYFNEILDKRLVYWQHRMIAIGDDGLSQLLYAVES